MSTSTAHATSAPTLAETLTADADVPCEGAFGLTEYRAAVGDTRPLCPHSLPGARRVTLRCPACGRFASIRLCTRCAHDLIADEQYDGMWCAAGCGATGCELTVI